MCAKILTAAFLLLMTVNSRAQNQCIKVGILGEFKTATGRTVSPFGVDIRNGVQVALEKLKKDHAPVCFSTTEIDINNSIANIPGLIDQHVVQDGIKLFLGLGISDQAVMAKDILKKHRALLVTPTASSDELLGKDSRQIMMFPRNSLIIESLVSSVLQRQLKKVAIISESNSVYSKGMAESFRSLYEQKGGRVVANLSTRKVSLTQKQVCALKSSQPQAIFMPIFELDAARIISYLDKCQINALIVGADSWGSSSEVIQAVTKSIHFRAILPKIYPLSKANVLNSEFEKLMRDKRKNDLSAFSYEGILLLAKMLKVCKREALLNDPVKCLSRVLPFESLTGAIKSTQNLSLDRPVFIRDFDG